MISCYVNDDHHNCDEILSEVGFTYKNREHLQHSLFQMDLQQIKLFLTEYLNRQMIENQTTLTLDVAGTILNCNFKHLLLFHGREESCFLLPKKYEFLLMILDKMALKSYMNHM